MRYFLDTEFIEAPGTIVLLSLGLVADDGRSYYVENADADFSQANDWVREYVLPNLQGGSVVVPYAQIGEDVRTFVGHDPTPEFWGYYADFDWVVFCWLFGAMADLPSHFPMYCRDLKQWGDQIGVSQWPDPPSGEHNALVDAEWNQTLWSRLDRLAKMGLDL